MCNQLGERFTGPQIWTPNSNVKFLATHKGPIYWYSDMPWSYQKPSPSLLHGWCHNFVVSVTGGQKQALFGWKTILSMKKWALEYIKKELHQIPPDSWDSSGEETIWDASKFHCEDLYNNPQSNWNSYYLAFD